MNPKQYHKLFESKTNNAHFITFDHNEDYVVKLFKRTEEKALINEWLAYCIARYMELPVAPACLVEMPKEFIDTIPNKDQFQYTVKHFASKYIENSVNGHEANVKSIINHKDLAGIIVFDYWLCNTDRTRKNVLLQEREEGSYFLWIIDQAEIFGSFSWITNDLHHLPQKIMKSATHEMMARFITDEEDFKKQVKLIQTIPTQLLEEILLLIPCDWHLSLEEQQEIIKALICRRDKVLPMLIEKFIKKVYRPIRNSRINGSSP